MRKRKRDGNHTSQKKKNHSIQNSVSNEKNGYPVPDLNKPMKNVTKEPNYVHKKPSKKKSLRNSWRRYYTCLTRMYMMDSRNFKTLKTKNMK
jgi:hypothetical protein